MTRRCVSARALERDGEPLEERFGAAMRLPSHELHQPDHAASASKRAATSSQPTPFCRASAASCCARHSASSVRSAIAAAAKLSSSRCDRAGHAIDHAFRDRAQILHDRGEAERLGLGDGEAERLALVAAIEHDARLLERRGERLAR